MATVPQWLLSAREPYAPRAEKGRYLEKNVLSVLGALAALRERPGAGKDRELLRPELAFVSTFLAILLVSLSRGWFFLQTAAAFEFGCLCLLKGEIIARVIKKVLAAGAFTLAIFAPAILIGRGGGVLILYSKVLLAVLAMAVFSAATPWPSIAAAMAALRIPGIFIMTLDMTIKYISLLGGLVLNMLYALKLRSVGRDERKMSSLGGLAGTLFLKSKDAAETQYQAMECRCFSGTYITKPRSRYGWREAILVGADLVLLAAFVAFGMAR
jgi:cobalt/nickel transport system permease protein